MKPAAFFDRTFLMFMLVGVVNTLVGSAIMFLLYNLAGLSYWLSSGANYFFTSILSFFLNKYFTFSVKDWSVQMVVSFALTIIIAYVIAYSIAKPLVYTMLKGYSEKVRGNVSLLCGMCLFTGLNYLGQRFVAFRTKKRKKHEGAEPNVQKNQG
jgi:putative flippase GtrA